MTLHPLNRAKIVHALIEFRKNYDRSQRDFCKAMGINPASYSTLLAAIRDNKPLDKIISDDKLIVIGRKLQVNFRNETPWKVVHIQTYDYIWPQLEHCQNNSIGRIFCDIADIGKTTVAKQYMLTSENVFYLDCGQHKSRTEFIRAIAAVVGVNNQGPLKDVYNETILMLLGMRRPLIILDEAGDLNYPAFLEIKSYWNALEGACGWYLMGADGLSKKIDHNIITKRVGYAEIYRRFGSDYMSVTKDMKPAELAQFKLRQVQQVAQHNAPDGSKLQDVINGTLSLTRVKENIRKASNNDQSENPTA